MKAIETIYNGYRFRSRLEARWAVFFDTLGIEYEYELEGYDLGDAGKYLPDFFIPKASWHIEIKASSEMITPEEARKMRTFDNYPPKNDKGELLSWGLIVLTGSPYMPIRDIHPVDIWFYAHSPHCDRDFSYRDLTLGYLCLRLDLEELPSSRIWDAVNKSKQARFEFGENGN